jgi:hypothetical protein
MRRSLSPWLARFSFSFFIGCGLLLWEAYRMAQGRLGPVRPWQIVLCTLGGLVCFVMGVVGIRERHRTMDDGEL